MSAFSAVKSLLHQAGEYLDYSQFRRRPHSRQARIVLETPSDLNKVNSFLNLRVADIWACYKQWGAKGAFFLTEPLDNHGVDGAANMRDPG